VAGTVPVFVTWKSQEFNLWWIQKVPRHRLWFGIHIQLLVFSFLCYISFKMVACICRPQCWIAEGAQGLCAGCGMGSSEPVCGYSE